MLNFVFVFLTDNWFVFCADMAGMLRFVNRHNSVVAIDVTDPTSAYYHPILNFLRRSRVHFALTHNMPIMIAYLREFWATATFDCSVDPSVIRAQVAGRDIIFTCADLREILHLGTEVEDDGPVEFSIDMRMGAFGRMGYIGDLGKSPYVKSSLYGQWRYLMHVLIQCISARKAGFDAMNARLQSLMIALVYNKPYSISRYIFDEFRQQINGVQRDRFLLYPRFVMLILSHFHPDIPSLDNTVLVSVVDRRIFADCRALKGNRPDDQQPRETPLFGHLVDPDYVAPVNDGWLDAESSDDTTGSARSSDDTTADQETADLPQHDDDMGTDAQTHVSDNDNSTESSSADDRSEDTESDSDDDHADDDAHRVFNEKFERVGGKLVLRKASLQSGESSRKRQIADDDDDAYLPVEEEDSEEIALRPRRSKARHDRAVSSPSPTTTTTSTFPPITTTIPLSISMSTPILTTTTPIITTAPISSTPTPPITSSDQLSAECRISHLEQQVSELSTSVTTLTDQLAANQTSSQEQIKTLNAHVVDLTVRAEAQRKFMLALEDMLKKLAAQGENSSCKEAELKRRNDEDRDDDPSAPKESELPGSSTQHGSKLSVIQGESGNDAEISGEAPVDAEEMIDALFGNDDELEEGEFIPQDVPEWKSDEEIVAVEDDDVDEHIVINQEMTEGIVEDNDGGLFEKVKELDSILVEESLDVCEEVEPQAENLKKLWFKELPKDEEMAFKQAITVAGAKHLKQGIICWIFDSELRLFILKRYDGLQYLKNSIKSFNSLPLCELKELARMKLINLGDDPLAAVMERIIKREVFSNNFEQLSPSKGKRMADMTRIDPRTNKPWMRMVYKPVKCLKKVPLKKMPQDILSHVKWWYIDKDTGEAVMQNQDYEELLRVYDPLHLVNLSKNDLLKLNKIKILRMDIWSFEAQKYQNVVKLCVEKGLHAGCHMFM